VSDSVVVFDQTIREIDRFRILAEALGVSEATVRGVLRLNTLAESISFNDGTLRLRMWDARVGETITALDDVQKTLLFAVLYDVRIFLGVQTEAVLGAHQDVFLNWSQPVNLGAYH
jgi:hypothetical protein